MTATQLDGLVTLLRSRAAPPDYDVAQSRARFEKTGASSWAARRMPSARRSMPAACRPNG